MVLPRTTHLAPRAITDRRAFYAMLKAKLEGVHKLDFIAVGDSLDTRREGAELLKLFSFLISQTNLKILDDSPRALRAVTIRVSTFSLTSYSGGKLPLTIHIGCERLCCSIRESSGSALLSEKKNGWETEEIAFGASGRRI